MSALFSPRKSRFDGHLDFARNGTVSGWALDRRSPRTRLPVLIKTRDYSVITTADKYREDLAGAGGYDGQHGFSVAVGSAIADGEPVHAWVGDYMLPNSPVIMSGTAFLGHVDIAANGIVSGWAFNRRAPHIRVSVFVKARDLHFSVLADGYRSDLLKQLGTDGFQAFKLHTGTAIPEGELVECYIANTDHALENSPITMREDGVARPYFAPSDAGRAYARAVIQGAYNAILHRAPGENEMSSQTTRFFEGLPFDQFVSELLNSGEAEKHRQMAIGKRAQSLDKSYQVLEAELIGRLSELEVCVQLTKVSAQAEDMLADAQLLRQALRALACGTSV